MGSVFFLLIMLILTACTAPTPSPSPTVIPPDTPHPTALAEIDDIPPTATTTPLPTETPTPLPSPTLTPTPRDYSALEAALNDYIYENIYAPNFTLGIGFIDLQSGAQVSINGEERHYALSTFKAALSVYYLWLSERGLIEELPGDEDYMIPMLNVSSNPATTCIVKRVGGLDPFNDWLGYQGFDRGKNFVLAWGNWACNADDEVYIPAPDRRYSLGDELLGLPGGSVLLHCAPEGQRCDKSFAPIELAAFYGRVVGGEVISEASLVRWLDWMEKSYEGSALFTGLPENEDIHVYSKNGFRAEDSIFDIHFYHEAGLIETPSGMYVLAVFMQGNPDWPGTRTINDISRIVYDYFAGAAP